MAPLSDGRLLVADAKKKGLLEIAQDGALTVLSTEANGVSFRFTNDLDATKSGDISSTLATPPINGGPGKISTILLNTPDMAGC
jgi:sugar lactone lactonase YvrE